MPVRNTILSLIPKPYYKTSIQRQLRCCNVLLINSTNKDGHFQSHQDDTKSWKVEKEVTLVDKFKARFPRTSEIVFLVKDGTTNLLSDIKDLTLLKTKNVHDLNLRELELEYETYLHIKRMIPIFFIFAIPIFGNIIVLFIAYIKPMRFLSPHFWSDKQKDTYAVEEHEKRVLVFLPIIKYLETKLSKDDCSISACKLRDVLSSVQKGVVPSLNELVACQELFGDNRTFSLIQVSPIHLSNLLILHNQRSFLLGRSHLNDWSQYIHLVDRAIRRNGGVLKLSLRQLKNYCFQRGVNANAMTEEEMREYLNQWMEFSKQILSNHSLLLLHAPALIGINHKSNLSVTNSLL